MSTPPSARAAPATRELTADELSTFVRDVLAQMQTRFQTMSDAIITQIDDMGERIEALEKSVNAIASESAGKT
jgi:heat shock factor-binding protein 1